MNRRRTQPCSARSSERGAALILALAVMVAIGGVLSGLTIFMSSSSRSSASLQDTRNQLYAADGAIEQSIRAVQQNTTLNGLVGAVCPAPIQPSYAANGFTVYIACAGQPAAALQGTQAVLYRNVLFTACEVPLVSNACPIESVIISAKVNFPTNAAGTITGAFVQSWSVRP
jgi:hypothetical protein